MKHRSLSRLAPLLAGGLGMAVVLAGCGGSGGTSGGGSGGVGKAASGVEIPALDCAPYKAFGDIKGKSISYYTTVVTPEDQPYIDSFKPFEKCTGATVKYDGSKDFEAQINVRVASGSAPDIAIFPQPGLLAQLVKTGKVVKAPPSVVKNVDANFTKDWKDYGTVDGTFYAAPLDASLKSLVWYSPSAFKDAGYTVPKTFEEMMALSKKIAADGSGNKPWCAGIGSGDATGWPATDWLEDVVLHQDGPDVYDQWISHQIPFNDPKITKALGTVGSILRNPDFVNGGLGGVQSIATTEFTDGGLPILDGTCFMHRQASFYQSNWGDGVKVGPDGDVWAFPWPTMDPSVGDAAVVAGEFVGAFSDRPEVKAFQTYLSSGEWANIKAKVSGGAAAGSANLKLDPKNVRSPIDKLSVEQFQNKKLTARFDASDLMPAAVGADAEWKDLTNWIANPKQSDQATTDAIEFAWPK